MKIPRFTGIFCHPLRAEGLPRREPNLLLNGPAVWQYNFPALGRIQRFLGQKSCFPALKELCSTGNPANPDFKAGQALGIEPTFGASWSFLGAKPTRPDRFYFNEFGVPIPGRELTAGLKRRV